MESNAGSKRSHFYATINQDHTCVGITYVMWSEEHFWNVSVLQRVPVSNFVTSCKQNRLQDLYPCYYDDDDYL
jgi:hypothetical protein